MLLTLMVSMPSCPVLQKWILIIAEMCCGKGTGPGWCFRLGTQFLDGHELSVKLFGVRYGGRSRQVGLCEPEGASPAGGPALVQISVPAAFLWEQRGGAVWDSVWSADSFWSRTSVPKQTNPPCKYLFKCSAFTVDIPFACGMGKWCVLTQTVEMRMREKPADKNVCSISPLPDLSACICVIITSCACLHIYLCRYRSIHIDRYRSIHISVHFG